MGQVLERKVADGELDFAVIAGRSSRVGIASVPVGEARFVWVGAPRAVGQATHVTPELLHQCPLVSLPEGAGTSRLLQAWQGTLAEAEHRLQCNNWGAIVGMLVEGTGVGLLPVHWAQALEQEGSLRILASDPAPGALPYSFQYRRDDSRVLVEKMRTEVMRAVDFSARCRLP